MRKQDLIVNLLLILSLVGLGWKLRKDWRNYAAENGPQRLEVHPINGVSLPPSAVVPDYTVVARQNPFHADRNDVSEQAAAQTRPTGPPPLIYGSLILGDTRFALMATELSPKAEQIPEGGVFEGYRLVKVLPESVVLESTTGRDEIMFYNALMRLRRQQVKTATAATRSSAPSQVASTGSSTAPTGLSAAEMSAAASTNAANSGNPQSTPGASAPPGKEIMNTPFGPIAVEKKKP